MIKYEQAGVDKGGILFLPVTFDDDFNQADRLLILVEVLDIRRNKTGVRAEVTPIASDGTCIWVDSEQL